MKTKLIDLPTILNNMAISRFVFDVFHERIGVGRGAGCPPITFDF
jgi:hypothetical protein